MKCPSCGGTGLHNGPFVAAVRPNCITCKGRGTVPADFEFQECPTAAGVTEAHCERFQRQGDCGPCLNPEPPCGDDCDDCEGRDERECGLEPVEIVVRDSRDLDYQGMARDLAASLSEANRNVDRLVAALIDCAESLHKTHVGWKSKALLTSRDSWQECDDPFCRKVADLLGSLIQSDRDRISNG